VVRSSRLLLRTLHVYTDPRPVSAVVETGPEHLFLGRKSLLVQSRIRSAARAAQDRGHHRLDCGPRRTPRDAACLGPGPSWTSRVSGTS